MNLLFDLFATQPNPTGKRHGGGKYGEIIFFKMVDAGMKFSCAYDSTIWLNPQVLEVCNRNNIALYDIHGDKWQEIVDQNRIDKIYSCLPYHLLNVKGCQIIATIHGLRGVELPFDIFTRLMYCGVDFKKVFFELISEMKGTRRLGAWNWYRRLIEKDNMEFVTVSNHSKYSMLSQYPDLRPEDIKVFYSPNTSIDSKTSKVDMGKYFLLVSTNRWDKNNLRAVMALDTLFSQGFLSGFKVILTGYKKEKTSWLQTKIFGDCELGKYKIKEKKRFVFNGYVNEDELNNLYANAYCFIYPSLNEGFGYPPLEAMRYGVPVIASAIASIPEILDNAALYFAPFSVEELQNRIMQMTENQVHSDYSKRSIERFKIIKKKQDEDLDSLIKYIIQG